MYLVFRSTDFSSSSHPQCRSAIATFGLTLNTSDLSLIYKYSPNAICAMIGFCQFDCCQTPVTPEQVHLSTGSDITQVHIVLGH